MTKVKPHILLLCFFVTIPWLQARAAKPAAEQPGSETMRVSLDGKWKLFYFPQGKYQIAHPDQLRTQGLTSIEASVPGNVELDLSAKGELPADLFFADNLAKLKPYELYEWWYQREFPTPAGVAGRRVELRFRGVDCLATYWLNGKELGETADALIEQRFDVTGKLNPAGPNILTVRLRSPIIEAASKRYDPAYTISAGKHQPGGSLDQEARALLRLGHHAAGGLGRHLAPGGTHRSRPARNRGHVFHYAVR